MSIQKCSRSEVCKATQRGRSELCHTMSANQTHCLQMTQFVLCQIMVLICNYVPIN